MMQTFLPYPTNADSAAVLDNKRLGKQRVETLQILRTLSGVTKGWQNHPAVKMWRGYEPALAQYGIAICDEWTNRGFQDTCRDKIVAILEEHFPGAEIEQATLPEWVGNERLHLSHQSNLVRKDPEHYSQHFDIQNDLPYYWPVQ